MVNMKRKRVKVNEAAKLNFVLFKPAKYCVNDGAYIILGEINNPDIAAASHTTGRNGLTWTESII